MAITIMQEPAQECRLLSDTFGWLVQASLGVGALISLYYKRHIEVPQRPFITWFRDASKQGIASIVAHFTNIIISYKLTRFGKNECKWYFINYVVDNVLGLLLNMMAFLLLVYVAQRMKFTFQSGYYGPPDSAWRVWAIQLSSWIVIVVGNKVILFYTVIVPLRAPLYQIGDYMLRSLDRWPRAELVFVMIIVPLTLNIGMLWIQDSFLKHDEATTVVYSKSPSSERAHLLRDEDTVEPVSSSSSPPPLEEEL